MINKRGKKSTLNGTQRDGRRDQQTIYSYTCPCESERPSLGDLFWL